MRRAINSAAVARQAGVSRTTVSFVLNGSDNAAAIPAATRERVLRAAEELGYQPNHMARVLLTGRSYLIRLLVERVHPAFYSRATESFHAALRGSGYDLHIQETFDWTPTQWEHAAASRWQADGFLVFEGRAFVPHLVAGVRGRVPIVNIGTSYDRTVPHVGVDLYQGTMEAVRHLAESGRRRIGYLGWDYVIEHSRGRGYQDEMQRRGLAPLWICPPPNPACQGGGDRAFAEKSIDSYLASGDPYRLDALICFNDEMAISALQTFKRHGRRVPDDIALVGCDGIEETRYHDPPLTTIAFPYEAATQAAWAMLNRCIEARENQTDTDEQTPPPLSHLFVPELVVRESSRASRSTETARATHGPKNTEVRKQK